MQKVSLRVTEIPRLQQLSKKRLCIKIFVRLVKGTILFYLGFGGTIIQKDCPISTSYCSILFCITTSLELFQ